MGLLADYMKKSLKELGRGFAGELTMSDGMEKLEKSLYLGMCVCFLCFSLLFLSLELLFSKLLFFLHRLSTSTIKNYLLHVNLTFIYIYSTCSMVLSFFFYFLFKDAYQMHGRN